ncbi:carbon monoxide dehydrogenase subunit G [Paracoccus sp. PS-1]|uniref:SRPBCC family protein n=1 Tax=unclassified Paracoccus (in: a-proteobacteria) TaxID=2688777 RepID=UPI0004AD47D9|nr:MULTISPECIES: carbon monoxide dehydrogenase subunit G [unclassified Paracoccus (in: a-proteobacteria)]MDQ7261358.1 carbon monoxide dehydrogenase subunit G [Paracoccus sp. PS1]
MKLSGERLLGTSRDVVWRLLNDGEVLQRCIPGCESLSGNLEDGYAAKVVLKIGPIKATFSGDVTFSEVRPGEGYRISGKGQGGIAGFASGGALVALQDDEGGTRLVYDAEAQVGGKIAQLGARLIDSTARKLTEAFFTKFAEEVAAFEAHA